MRTRIFIALAALLFPLVAFADAATDRDVLLAFDGTLYTVESVPSETLPTVTSSSTRVLLLTVQNGDHRTQLPVPASLSGGVNIHPTLAYDNESKTIFVFWEASSSSGLSSVLLFCSFQDGRWGTPKSLDSVALTLRQNLRIAVTTKTEQTNADGTVTLIPEINVHAVWWQDDGARKGARYAMLTISDGDVKSAYIGDAADFIASPTASPAAETQASSDLLRYPAVLESAAHDSVDIVFGDIATTTMHRITIKPIAVIDGRLRIPVGRRDADLPVYTAIVSAAKTAVSAISSGPDNLAFYFSTEDALKYFVLKGGKWSSQSIALSTITRDAAVDALRRMLSSD
jgi:hypothetical protein